MNEDFNSLIDSAKANEQFNMPQLNIQEYETLTCDKCGGVAFRPGIIIKKIPGVLVGSKSKYQLLPDQILICDKCGTILKKDREYYNLDDNNMPLPIKKEEKKSSIII